MRVRHLVSFLALLLATTASASTELKLIAERQSLTATWRTYRQVIDGADVYGTDVIQRIDRDGRVHEVHRTLATRAAHRPLIAAATARGVLPAGRVVNETLAALNVDGEARPVWRVVVEERPMEPVAHYVDAATGALLKREPLFWRAKARVFDVNPVAKLNRPDLQDDNNAASAVPPEAYSDIDLDNLAPSGPLAGPNVTIVDTEAPFTARADASQPLIFDRSQPQFEEVNAYFHIDRSAKYLQSLGYAGPRRIVAYSIPVDAHAANGTDNSYYISNGNATGALYFGDGGTDDAEDPDIMLHEFGHAIQDWIAPGAFTGEPTSQSAALAEGLSDYWAFSSNYAGTVASGRDPFCIGDWDARCGNDDASQQCGYPLNADCLRRIDSPRTMADYQLVDASGTQHLNGEIWSSALREIFLSAGKEATDRIVLEALYGTAPNPTYAGVAQRLLGADDALYGGVHAASICGAMTKRGILADCAVMPRGELTTIESITRGLPLDATSTAVVTDDRTIVKLMVRVDIQHPSRGDLKIVLVGPDGTSVILQQPSLDRGADVHGTFGLDIQPAESLDAFVGKPGIGTWKLIVTDTANRGSGTLLSWALVIRFNGDAPQIVRPFPFGARLHIAAVAHTDGANGSRWRSDLFLLNRGPLTKRIELIFTPSGADGSTNFGAINVEIAAQQNAAVRDIVSSLFNTSGGGTLEIQGDLQSLVAWSRTYDESRGMSETIEPVSSSESTTVTNVFPLTTGGRANVGVFETEGESGTVTIDFYNGALRVATISFPIAPFSHVQLPAPNAAWAIVSVTGAARINAYGSIIDPGSGDPMFVPARIPHAIDAVVPVAAATEWNTVMWSGIAPPQSNFSVPATFYSPAGVKTATISLPFAESFNQLSGTAGSIELQIPDGVLVTTRIAALGRGDRVDPVPISEAIGGDVADIVRIESDPAYRTNLGATEVMGAPVTLRFTLFDAGGNVVGFIDKSLAPHQQLQFSLGEITFARVVDGRVRVSILDGDGRAIAYGSVVDNVSGDSEFVRAR